MVTNSKYADYETVASKYMVVLKKSEAAIMIIMAVLACLL